MILIKPSYEILVLTPTLDQITEAYKSENKITDDSSEEYESVIEHSILSVKFVVDQGVSHELAQHRLCAFSQEATRYCNYSDGITFIIPPWLDIEPGEYLQFPFDTLNNQKIVWLEHMLTCEYTYINLIQEKGWSPQQARSVLPNSLKTEIIITANFREWGYIFKLRTSTRAHPQMREVMIPLLKDCQKLLPTFFSNI